MLREEVQLDPDEFDLNFYHLRPFGLRKHAPHRASGKPGEQKIEELALVIDTSYSTSGELVRAFLAETYTC